MSESIPISAIGQQTWPAPVVLDVSVPENICRIVWQVVLAYYGRADMMSLHIVELETMKLKHVATLIIDMAPSSGILAESLAFDFVAVLVRGRALSPYLHRLSVTTFGQKVFDDLIYLVGLHILAARARSSGFPMADLSLQTSQRRSALRT